MKNFKVKVYIDISNPEHVSALNSFLGVIGDQDSTEVVEKKPTRTRKIKPATTQEVKEEITVVEETTDTSIKIEDVRACLTKKVTKHRQVIKDKLTELGAANVTSLEVKHYEAFTSFLMALK